MRADEIQHGQGPTPGRAYCGRKTTKGHTFAPWRRVDCGDCLAAYRADGNRA